MSNLKHDYEAVKHCGNAAVRLVLASNLLPQVETTDSGKPGNARLQEVGTVFGLVAVTALVAGLLIWQLAYSLAAPTLF